MPLVASHPESSWEQTPVEVRKLASSFGSTAEAS